MRYGEDEVITLTVERASAEGAESLIMRASVTEMEDHYRYYFIFHDKIRTPCETAKGPNKEKSQKCSVKNPTVISIHPCQDI